ncbi:MAG: 2-C-methyl-D-erythritol 4-phosphate cytidylyltransferase, partial [Finegoldia magna]|nr:2-C-methyl-D-erythritol 4-phosphate cytidylyltransferase [Finegoldia magna]
DTIKYVDDDMRVVNTPNRSHLYMAQTPQVFKYKSIKDAYKLVFDEKINVTDDSSLLEIVGKKVKIIKGDYSNIKITTQEDLLFGELIARKRENE